jgi:hypothetical protein
MKTVAKQSLVAFIEQQIPTFHQKRLESLASLKLGKVMARKNPYLFKAKNVETANQLVRLLVDAHLSSQEETVFGDFLESLAIFICQQVYGGRKSTTEGIDLEFERDGQRYLVAIKSGPNWGNSSQIKRMLDNFRQARKILGSKQSFVAVNGCCYGRDIKPEKGNYVKLCGQNFWELVSGDDAMYTEIIEPLGHQAKKRNEDFSSEYDKVLNRFQREFLNEYCDESGAINWPKIVAFNAARDKPKLSGNQDK